jgi:inosine-uridine nucleoside N-ribohydrolase
MSLRAKQTFMFTDPGVDDSLALIMATLSGRIELIGACASAGNVPSTIGVRNLAYISNLLGSTFPVFRGRHTTARQPMFDGRIAHGRWGLGWFRAPRPTLPIQSFAEIARHLSEYDKFSVLCTSPMSDLAPLITNPAVSGHIEKVVAMGGGASGGNATPVAEFNVRFNPEAASKVLGSGIPVQMATLDLTQTVRFSHQDISFMDLKGSEIRETLSQAMKYYFRFHLRYEGFSGCYVHDPTAAAALIWPELFEAQHIPASVETKGKLTYGATVFDRRHRSRSKPSSVAILSARSRSRVKSRILQLLSTV